MEMKFDVLNHGFVRYVDHMGDDAAIVQAARVSYGEGTKTPSDDRALIRYLMRHQHTTPFEMCEVKIHVKMPIFVARQWVRHRTANINEYSARYSVLKSEFFIPENSKWHKQSIINKQGSSDVLVDIVLSYSGAEDNYKKLLDLGVAREQARVVLPLATYTEWYWKCDLHNIFHFLKLRMDSHAQYEIRVYAEALSQIIKQLFPVAYEAFEDYSLNARNFSAMEIRVLKRLLRALPNNRVQEIMDLSDMSSREQKEFLSCLDLDH